MTLILESHQIVTLRQAAIDDYLRIALPHLAATFPAKVAERGDAGLHALATLAVAKVLGHGLERAADATAMASLMLLFGDDVVERPEHAWLREILASPVLHADSKMDLILARMATETARSKG